MLAGRRRAFRNPADGEHGRSPDGRAQRRHVPHAGLRRPYDGHALAYPQDGGPALRCLETLGAADARVGGAGRRSGLYLCRDGADARQHGRIPAGRVPAPPSRETREVRHQRYLCPGRLRLRDRGLCRPCGGESRRRPLRRPYGVLFARRPLSAFPRHGPHAAAGCGIPGHGRGDSSAGGRLYRAGNGADIPGADTHGPAARNPRHDDARGRNGA